MDEQIEQIARAIAETVADGDDIDIQEALENHFDWITPEQAKRMIDAAARAAHSVMAGKIAELRSALEATIPALEGQIESLTSSYRCGFGPNKGKVTDPEGLAWIAEFQEPLDKARAALAPPRHD